MNIGIVGLGNMGGRIAARLMQSGFSVGVFDRDPKLIDAFAKRGATGCASLADLAAKHRIVITVLPDANVVRQVVLGDEGLAAAMTPGDLLIDITTSVTSVTRHVAAVLAERGIRMIDAPVSGGVAKAEDGTLAVIVGGEDADVAAARPVLECIGSNIVHVGDVGAGHTVKALNNLISATTLSITAEAMAVGVKMGIDAQKMLDAINVGSGRSASSEIKFPKQILSRKFDPGFSMKLMCKDLGIAVDMANEVQMPAWIAVAVHQLMGSTASLKAMGRGHTVIARAFWRSSPGCEA